MKLLIKKLSENAIIPTKNKGDCGYDLYSTEDYELEPLERKLFKTNIAMVVPEGYYGEISDRSGKAYKDGLHIMGGQIDSTYRGDIGIILINLKHESGGFDGAGRFINGKKVQIYTGDKIAQIKIQKYEECTLEEVENLDESARGENGYGSSGR